MKEWQNKIKAFLHDPPDKALILGYKSHEKRRDEILQTLKLTYDKRLDSADHIASAMQRINLTEELQRFSIYFKNPIKPIFKHTLSGETENLDEIKDFIATYGYEKTVSKFSFDPRIINLFLNKNEWKKTYFLLWRFLPEKYPLGYILPADTRIPDHSIWDHLDVTSAIYSCLKGGLSLFSVKLPGVQEFISHSRKLSDLWASSHIFSTVIFEGIKVIVDELGPDVIIYPQLRGNPMLDFAKFKGKKGEFTLFNEGKKIELIDDRMKEKLCVANLPNTFLAFVPYSEAEEFAKKVENAIKQKWKEIAEKTKKLLENAGIKVYEQLWCSQIENTIEVTSAWLEFFNFDKFNNVKKEVPKDLKNNQEKWLRFVEEVEKKSNYGHFYSLTYEILSAVLTQKSRFWNDWNEEPKTGKKCLMCGRRNALLLRDEHGNYKVYDGKNWSHISSSFVILKEGERLCAVCLVKRLYRITFLEIFKDARQPPWESVAEIAARDFIDRIKNQEFYNKIKEKDIELIYDAEWESKDLVKKRFVEELGGKSGEVYKDLKRVWEIYGKPNKYYAILMMDGDRIGKMLSGENLPELGEFLHPAFKNKIQGQEKGEELINTKRILTPSHHIAISRAMKDFSLYKVREIVKKYNGFLVYAGGDDVLALFPADKVLDAAYEIQNAFREDFYEVNGKKIMGLGNKASMSAGIVFANYKWPLYDVLERVREAEKNAKSKYGRDAFCITFIKRSGEVLTAGGKWKIKNYFDKILKLLSPDNEKERKLSHRFIYDFIEIARVLKKENEKWEEPYISMLKADIKRLLKKRNYKGRMAERDIENTLQIFSLLIGEYVEKRLPLEDIGLVMKILYDAYRGEER